MQAFTIKTSKSDYPFLVIADGFKNAVEVLYQKGIYDTDIISVQNMESFVSDHIIIEGRWCPEDIDATPVSEIISYLQRNWPHNGCGVRVNTFMIENNINTIGDLMRISRKEFKKFYNIGQKTVKRIDEALEELYNIKGW